VVAIEAVKEAEDETAVPDVMTLAPITGVPLIVGLVIVGVVIAGLVSVLFVNV
jgi:hypothetical protein